jgi:hypothetical protein
MKFIYFTNGIYDQDTLTNNITMINELNKKESPTDMEIIYGGNQINPNFDIKDDKYNSFLSTMGSIDKKISKYIMYGGSDLVMNSNPNSYPIDLLSKSIDYYKPDQNFKNIFILDYKLVNNTFLIFFNNQIDYIEPNDTLITNTSLKYLLTLNPTKYTNLMTISNLIQLQIDEIGLILKKNHNIKSVVFITQSPLFELKYNSGDNNTLIEKSFKFGKSKFLEFVDRYFYLLSNLKLYYVCGDLMPRNEIATITLEKKDNQNNTISQLVISQYIIGTNYIQTNEELEQNNKLFDKVENEIIEQIEIESSFTKNKYTYEIKYNIEESDKNLGFVEFEIDDKNTLNSPISFNFIDAKKIIDEKKTEKKTKIDGFKKHLKKNFKKNDIFKRDIIKNIDNIDISISNSDNFDINNDEQLTEEGDPYKEKYLKYKKKLHKLRELKNNKNNKKY